MKDRIIEIFKRAKKIEEFEGKEVIFLEEEDFKTLWGMRQKDIDGLIQEGNTPEYAKKAAMRDYFKLINPVLKPVKVVSFNYKQAYSMVRTKEIILEKYLESDFYKWANHLRKETKKFIKDFVNDEKEVKKVMDEVEEKIKQKKKILDEILKNPDKYELLRTDVEFKDTIYQPVLNVRVYNPDTKVLEPYVYNIYLRDKVPNVVWEWKEPIPKKRRPRPILDGLKNYENVFGKIYIKRNK